jgi:hypothetical protein
MPQNQTHEGPTRFKPSFKRVPCGEWLDQNSAILEYIYYCTCERTSNMFQLWMDVINEQVQPCLYVKRVRRFLRRHELRFGGDYDFQIYVVGKLDHATLQVAAEEYMRQDGLKHRHRSGSRWADASTSTPLVWPCSCPLDRSHSLQSCSSYPYEYMREILNHWGCSCDTDIAVIGPLFPRREDLSQPLVGHALDLYNDGGNFRAVACETQRFYYIFEKHAT